MAADGRAVESRDLRAIRPDRWTSCGPYEHRGDGRRSDQQSTHRHRERRILAERHGASAHDRNVRKGARPLRPRSPLTLVDGRNPQDDADAGAATRGPCAGDAAEGTPAGRRRRRYHDLRSSNGDRPLDLPATVARARWHSTRDRERGVSRRERTGRRRRRAGQGDTSTTLTEARSYGTTKPVILTTSKSVARSRFIVSMSASFQRTSGAPVTKNAPPLSATIMP